MELKTEYPPESNKIEYPYDYRIIKKTHNNRYFPQYRKNTAWLFYEDYNSVKLANNTYQLMSFISHDDAKKFIEDEIRKEAFIIISQKNCI